jgi:hypothetical protein
MSVLSAGLALCMIDQVLPFQCSIPEPTAKQLVGLGHDTPTKPT